MDKTQAEPYHAYLLRCWRDGLTTWRFSIEPVSAEPKRHGFATLEQLFAFLRGELAREMEEANRRKK